MSMIAAVGRHGLSRALTKTAQHCSARGPTAVGLRLMSSATTTPTTITSRRLQASVGDFHVRTITQQAKKEKKEKQTKARTLAKQKKAKLDKDPNHGSTSPVLQRVRENPTDLLYAFQAGRALLYGDGVERDVVRAIEHLTVAAEQGSPDAMFILGVAHTGVQDIPKNISIALEWWFKAGKAGSAESAFNAGLCLMMGDNVTPDFTRAEECFIMAKDLGMRDAALMKLEDLYCIPEYHGEMLAKDEFVDPPLCDILRDHGVAALNPVDENGKPLRMKPEDMEHHQQSAFWIWKRAAELGSGEAYSLLSECYAAGRGTEVSQELCIDALVKGSELGCAKAMFDLGSCYEVGIWVARDMTLAEKYWKMAAELNYEHAQTALAKLKSLQDGEESQEEAQRLIDSAAEAESPEAMYLKGSQYIRKGDYVQGRAMMAKAALAHHPEATAYLAEMYAHGLCGTEVNEVKAHEFYEAAAKLGVASAMHNCAVLYAQGGGLCIEKRPNMRMAMQWWKVAADAGDIDASYSYGIMLVNGEEELNITEGARYLKMAAENEHPAAQCDYGVLLARGWQGLPGIEGLDAPGQVGDEEAALVWIKKSAANGHEEALEILKVVEEEENKAVEEENMAVEEENLKVAEEEKLKVVEEEKMKVVEEQESSGVGVDQEIGRERS